MIRSRLGYTALLWAALPHALARLAWRARREPGYLERLPERFGCCTLPAGGPVIWIHAVSVGETRAAQPLIEALRDGRPDHRILLTHMTPAGRATGIALYGDRVLRCWLPYDFPSAVARFLDRVRPVAGVLMETEVWFNLIHACRTRGVPLHLANARLSQRSRERYARVPELAREAFAGLATIAAQSEDDAARFRSLGAQRVVVTGNVKFDITPPPALIERGRAWRAAWGPQRPVFVAASTRDGEEAALLDALAATDAGALLTVIVPRHPQRFDQVAALIEHRGFAFQRLSTGRPLAAGTRVLLGDSMGELYAYYAAADVAFVGGSLEPLGAHNLVEPCAVGCPVVLGPSDYNFAEAARDAAEAGALERAADARAVVRLALELVADPSRRARMSAAGVRFAAAHRGATARVLRAMALG